MKKVFLFVLTILFLASTSVVSAWAQPCMHDMSVVSSISEELPCHQEKEQRTPSNNHCEGECLCIHAVPNSSFFLSSSDGVRLPIAIKQSFALGNDTLISVNQSPLKRPPKYIS
jgi:hypothetical protein